MLLDFPDSFPKCAHVEFTKTEVVYFTFKVVKATLNVGLLKLYTIQLTG